MQLDLALLLERLSQDLEALREVAVQPADAAAHRL
jgi:hypothetical protein